MRKHIHTIMGLGALILTSAAIAAVHFGSERSDDDRGHADQAISGVRTR